MYLRYLGNSLFNVNSFIALGCIHLMNKKKKSKPGKPSKSGTPSILGKPSKQSKATKILLTSCGKQPTKTNTITNKQNQSNCKLKASNQSRLQSKKSSS